MIVLTESASRHIRDLLRTASLRREFNEFVIEGRHLLEVALDKRPDLIDQILFTEAAAASCSKLFDRCINSGLDMLSVSPKLASRISDTQEPQGIFAVLKMPVPKATASGNVILALDAVQDPGNVGTIIRTAAWFGVTTIFLGEGTADPFSPKVVRSTQGAIFDVDLHNKVDLASELPMFNRQGWNVLAATLSEAATSVYELQTTDKTLLLLGSEAHGISDVLLSLSDAQIIVPRFGEGESLNVATSAAVILSEIRRRGLR